MSQTHLAEILAIADDAIISTNAQQQITLFNQGAERIFGYTATEAIGQPLDMLLPTRFEAAHRRHLAACTASADAVRHLGQRQNIYGRRKDGSEFPAEASIAKVEFTGELVFTVILRNVSLRKQVEQTLHVQNDALERAIRAKDRFLSSMSHELRTLLNAIIGFTGTLLMKLPGPLNAEQEKQLRTIQASGKHLLALINDLLDVAKIEFGNVELWLERVDCQEVIADVVAGLRSLAEQKRIGLTVLADVEPIVTRSDRRALSQILLNLMKNAIAFTDAGEVRIELARLHAKEAFLRW